MDLSELRDRLTNVDRELIALVAERQRLSREIARAKRATGHPTRDFRRERDVIVTDTVGFIRDLPPELVAGFKSTLEEIRDATVLLHVVDASSAQIREQIDAVHEILAELGLGDKPELLLLNKADRLTPEERAGVAKRFGGICISALKGDGIPEALQAAERLVFEGEKT